MQAVAWKFFYNQTGSSLQGHRHAVALVELVDFAGTKCEKSHDYRLRQRSSTINAQYCSGDPACMF